MKKIVTISVLILFISLISAELNLSDVNFSKLTSNISGKGLNQRTEDILNREANLPPTIESLIRLFLRVKENPTWVDLIVALGFFIIFTALIYSIIVFLPLTEKGGMRLITSLIVSLLASITGVLKIWATMLYELVAGIKWVGKADWLTLLVLFIILILFIWVVNNLVRWFKIKRKIKIEKARQLGEKLRRGKNLTDILSEELTIDTKKEKNKKY